MKVASVRTLRDALSALRDAGPNVRILAGGTDLMVEMESGRTRPESIVDVWRVLELRAIRETQEGVTIGALASCTELLENKAVSLHADILVEAARTVGAVQIRNRATIGGNLGTSSPAADLNPVLFALGARVRLESLRGTREIAVESFVKGYRTNDRASDELITAVVLPRRPPHEKRAFKKVGTRRAQSISKVVVAAAVESNGSDIVRARISAGSVADRTILLDGLCRELVGRRFADDAAIMDLCRVQVDASVAPRDDVRSTARYRRFVLIRILAQIVRDAVRVK
ncbi:MAG: FAD binding domain-containing protein [Planctomycetota bacterium]|nr:FAD binding domain-containing protein [Planctomycetota bacterium]